MDHYEDIELLPDPEFPPTLLMNALFSKFHRCLVNLRCNDVAVSFPRSTHDPARLGTLLRLHGTKESLERLHAEPWLHGMRDHVHIRAVLQIPNRVAHRHVRRVQAKSNPDRIRRRQMKRHGWTAEEARRQIPDSAARLLSLPYLEVESASSGRRFRLFVDQREAPGPTAGPFNAYGLSQHASVPWF